MLQFSRKRSRIEILPNGTIGDVFMPKVGGELVVQDRTTGVVNLIGAHPRLQYNGVDFIPDSPFDQACNTFSNVQFYNMSITNDLGVLGTLNSGTATINSLNVSGTINSTGNMTVGGSTNTNILNATNVNTTNLSNGGDLSTATLTCQNISTVSNQDLILNAAGLGKIKINTVPSKGVIIGLSSLTGISDHVCICKDGNISNKSLVMGVYQNGSSYQAPYIGAQFPGVSWQPLFIGAPTSCNVFGGDYSLPNPESTYSTTSYNNVFVGNTNFHGGSIYVGGNLFCNTTRDITCSNVTVEGIVNASNVVPLDYLQASLETTTQTWVGGGAVWPLNNLTTNRSNILSINGSGEVVLPLGAGVYEVGLGIPMYTFSKGALYDGNNTVIPGTLFSGGYLTPDTQCVINNYRFIIKDVALNKFTLRGHGGALYIGDISSASSNYPWIRITVRRIA